MDNNLSGQRYSDADYTLILVSLTPFLDPQLAVRLIAAHQSGHAEIYTLSHSGSPVSWSVSSESVPCKAMSDPTPESIYIMDRRTGARWKADRARLSSSLKGSSAEAQCFLVTVGAKGARSTLNINGEKIGKVEWGNKVGTALSSQIVEHMGMPSIFFLRLVKGS